MAQYRVILTAPSGAQQQRNVTFDMPDINWFRVRVRDMTTGREGVETIRLYPYPRAGFGTQAFGANTFGG